MNEKADVHLYNVNTVVCMCNHFAVEGQQCILCVLLSYMSLPTTYKYWVLHNNAVMVNLLTATMQILGTSLWKKLHY